MLLLDISNSWKTAIMVVLMIIVFYFFLIRPQSQQEKKERQYREGLKNGDRVMTAGGIHATFINASNGMATIEVCPGTRIKVQLSSLSPIPEVKAK